jgi:D-amino peptidase
MKITSAYISVDIEGIAGVTEWEETQRGGNFNAFARKQMAEETNAAIEALLDAGVEKIYVKDAHGDGRNINPPDLNENAMLIRGHVMGPELMVALIDQGFDAALFIGYHAKPGTQHSPLRHFFSTDIARATLNGVELSEGSYNALIAGYYEVPVIFLSGDKAACDDIESQIPNIETVAVKEGYRRAIVSHHPNKARQMVKDGVARAITNVENIDPFKMKSPYVAEVEMKSVDSCLKYNMFEGAKLIGSKTIQFESDDMYKMIRFITAFGAKFM